MCGILCTVCASTNAVQCKKKKIVESVKPFLARRGPDHFGEKQIGCSPSDNDGDAFMAAHPSGSSNACNSINLASVVLHLRGESIAKQPVEDGFGNILAWNGEIFDGLEVREYESDTTALLRNLHTSSDEDGVEHVLKTMSRIHGPWAFVYYQANHHTLWFGRDYFGRRSLLCHFPSSNSDLFALSSVGTRFTKNIGEQFWMEVPAIGIYSVDVRMIDKYFSSRDENAEDFETVFRPYPWQNPTSLEYPVCPVRNQFNKDIECNIDSNQPASVTNSDVPCHSSHDVESASLEIEDNIANDTKIRISDISHSDPFKKDIAHNPDNNPTTANNDGITELDNRTCVTRAIANFHVKPVTYENNKIHGHTDRSVKEQDIFPCSVVDNEQLSSTRLPGSFDGTCYSSKLSPRNHDAATISLQPSTCGLDNQRPDKNVTKVRIDQDVVEQFAKVLMEAVRRRVFNLPRKTKTESCRSSGAAQRNYSAGEEKASMCVENKSSCNVGILFSGGLDSIVLAALADKCVPFEEPIDLINVAFEQKSAGKDTKKQGRKHKMHKSETYGANFEVPDRITGLSGVAELKLINPDRTWNFVKVDVTLEELQKERSNYITHLICPQSTVLDDSIGCALWFAARGQGTLTCNHYSDNPAESSDHHPPYTCPAKVLLVGMGADEQLGGYARHRSRFQKEGWRGLVDEIEMEVKRISERNLGRDDRCISDHGRESRCPFLDEDVVSFLNALPVWTKCDPRLPRGIGEKILLRQVAKSLGLTCSSELPKRAIQFGSRIAKLESSSEKGSEKCSRF